MESAYDDWKCTAPPEPELCCEGCKEPVSEAQADRTTDAYELQLCEACEWDLVKCENCKFWYTPVNMAKDEKGARREICCDCEFDAAWWKE